MGELRKSLVLDEWVIIEPLRAQRPTEVRDVDRFDASLCVFCPGNESKTPGEIGRVEKDGVWVVRWFDNKFPCVLHEEGVTYGDRAQMYNYGYHEIIVEAREHDCQLWDLSVSELECVLGVYEHRIDVLKDTPGIKYVVLTKNHGVNSGGSLFHTHSQVIALPIVPPRVNEKIVASKKAGECLYCLLVERERDSERTIFENDEFLAVTPFAPRFSYEAWILPKQHKTQLGCVSKSALAEALQVILQGVRKLDSSYNHFLTYSPAGEDLHVHFEIMPRRGRWGGLECGGGVVGVTTSPEDAAKFYRNLYLETKRF